MTTWKIDTSELDALIRAFSTEQRGQLHLASARAVASLCRRHLRQIAQTRHASANRLGATAHPSLRARQCVRRSLGGRCARAHQAPGARPCLRTDHHHPCAEKIIIDTLQQGEVYKHPLERGKVCIINGTQVAILAKQRDGRLLITDFSEEREEQLNALKVKGAIILKG